MAAPFIDAERGPCLGVGCAEIDGGCRLHCYTFNFLQTFNGPMVGVSGVNVLASTPGPATPPVAAVVSEVLAASESAAHAGHVYR